MTELHSLPEASRILSTRGWIVNTGLWAGLTIVQTFQNYSGTLSEGVTPHLDKIALLQLATWFPWAFITPILFWICKQYPLERFFSRNSILLTLAGIASVLLIITIHTASMYIAPEWIKNVSFGRLYVNMLRWLFLPQLIIFAGVVGAAHAHSISRRLRERERQAAQLQQQLTEAQLRTLQTQLQPHFFFNTLHSIASLIRDRQNDGAVKMIAQLSELMRYTLDQVNQQKIPLSQELEFIHRYLEIEQTRFSDRLKVEMAVKPDTLIAQIPSLLLQPIVENAIRHGLSHLATPGKLRIQAERADGKLVIEITNDGAGLIDDWQEKAERQVGLRNVRNRLEQLYGNNHRFELRESGRGVTIATISIPFETNGHPWGEPT